MSPFEHWVTIYYAGLFSRLGSEQGPRMRNNNTVPMLESIDRNNQIFLIKNICFPRPPFNVFVILCHFLFHPFIKIFPVSLNHQNILSQHFTNKFFNKEWRVNKYLLVSLFCKYLCLKIFQIVSYYSIVEISLRSKFL